MTKGLAGLLLISFVGVFALGLFSMVLAEQHENMRGCIVEISGQGSCPKAMNDFDLLIYHIDVFRSFTQTSLPDIFAVIPLILYISLLFTLAQKIRAWGVTIFYNFLESDYWIKFSNWLSIREKSPSY